MFEALQEVIDQLNTHIPFTKKIINVFLDLSIVMKVQNNDRN